MTVGNPHSGRNGTADCEVFLRTTTTVPTRSVPAFHLLLFCYLTLFISTLTITVTTTVDGPASTTDLAVVTHVETTTASTETVVEEQTTTVADTLTVIDTVTQTIQPTAVKARGIKDPLRPYPPYAWVACGSFERYQSACSRVGITPTTVTVAPAKTVTATKTVQVGGVATSSTTVTVASSVTATTLVTKVVTVTTTDATVTSTATATATAVPDANIVANGGFESGTLEGWTVAQNSTATVVSPGYNSGFSLRLGPLFGRLESSVTTTFVGTAGTTYSCQFDWMIQEYLLGENALLPSIRLLINEEIKASPFLRTGRQGVWDSFRSSFTYVSTGSDVARIMAYSAQAESAGVNFAFVDNVSCVPAA